jgi:hypothetical protein
MAGNGRKYRCFGVQCIVEKPPAQSVREKGMDTQQKLDVVKETYIDSAELDLVVEKLLDLARSQHRLRLARYERDLRAFEQRYSMDSVTFYRRFEAGELGDAMDFCEWAGLYELRQDLLEKLQRLEDAV